MELLDRRGGLLDLEHFEEAALEFVDQARTTGRFERVSTRFDASAPQLELIADGELMAVPGLPFRATLCRRSVPPSADDASATPIMRGRVRRIYVRLKGAERAKPGDLLCLKVANREGDLLSAAEVVRLEPRQGSDRIERYEQTHSITITALPRAGIGNGQVIASLQELSDRLSVAMVVFSIWFSPVWLGKSSEGQKAAGYSSASESPWCICCWRPCTATFSIP